MNQETMEKVKILLESENQDVIEAIEKVENPEGLVDYLRSQNIDITSEDIRVQETGDDEISEADLEAVSGGLKIRIPFTNKTIGIGFWGGYTDSMGDRGRADYQLFFYKKGYDTSERIKSGGGRRG